MKNFTFAKRSHSLIVALNLLWGHSAIAQENPAETRQAPPPPTVMEYTAEDAQVNTRSSAMPTVPVLGWQEALDLAMRKHPAIEGARQRLNASNFDLEAAEYQRFPTPAVDFGRIGGGGSGNQASVSLTQPLYAFGRIDSGIAAAENRVGAATVAIEETRIDLIDRVLVAFFEVNKTRELVEVQKTFVKQHEDLRDTVQRRFAGDVGSQSDLLLAQTRLDQALNQQAIYESQFNRATATLQSLIKTVAVDYQAPEPMLPNIGSETQLQQMALNFSPTIKRLIAERDALKEEANVASASTKPQLVLRAERVESNVPTNFSDNRIITALQYQPGAGFSGGSLAAAAESRAVAAELDVQAAQLQLAERCAALYNDMAINLSQEKNLAKVLDANQGFFESMLRQFQAGKRSWLDVLNSVRETNQSAAALVTARNDAQMNVRRVNNLAGLDYKPATQTNNDAKNDESGQ